MNRGSTRAHHPGCEGHGSGGGPDTLRDYFGRGPRKAGLPVAVGLATASKDRWLVTDGETVAPVVPREVTGDSLKASVSLEIGGPTALLNIEFRIKDLLGVSVANFQPFLGAPGHLVIFRTDSLERVHATRLRAVPRLGAFRAHLPSPTIYRPLPTLGTAPTHRRRAHHSPSVRRSQRASQKTVFCSRRNPGGRHG